MSMLNLLMKPNEISVNQQQLEKLITQKIFAAFKSSCNIFNIYLTIIAQYPLHIKKNSAFK